MVLFSLIKMFKGLTRFVFFCFFIEARLTHTGQCASALFVTRHCHHRRVTRIQTGEHIPVRTNTHSSSLCIHAVNLRTEPQIKPLDTSTADTHRESLTH